MNEESKTSSVALAERYEELRQEALSNANSGSLGLALFLHHGMVAWMKAWSKYQPAETMPSPTEKKEAPLSIGWDLRAEFTTIIANILLTHQQERFVPC